MSDNKLYVGGAKEVSGNFGSFHKISFSKDDIDLMAQNLNDKGYVNLNMNKRRQPSQYGQTHRLVIDTWRPNDQQQQQQQQQQHHQQQQHQAPVYTPPVHQEPASQVIPSALNFDEKGGDLDDDIPFAPIENLI